jgi:hypothetical protein
MKFPNFKRIFKQDFKPEEQPLIEKLSVSINSGFEMLFEAMNRKISFRDNILCTIKDVDVTVDSDGTPLQTVGITLDTSNATNRVDGVMVIKADNLTSPGTYPTTAPFISYQQNTNTILFNNITGLAANQKYRLRVLAILS